MKVSILGADLSPEALAIYKSLLNAVSPALEQVGVSVEWEGQTWDIMSMPQTVLLCNKWFGTAGPPNEYLVLISNIGGVAKGHMTQMTPQIRHMFERMCVVSGRFIWVESIIKSADMFYSKLVAAIQHIPLLKSLLGAAPKAALSYYWRCPIRNETIRSGVRVVHAIETPHDKDDIEL